MRVWIRWSLATGAAEVIAVLFAVLIGTSMSGTGTPLAVVALMAVAVAGGLLVGVSQWLALRPAVPGLDPVSWMLSTLVLGLAPWAAGVAVATFGPGEVPPVGILALAGAWLGLAVGLGSGTLGLIVTRGRHVLGLRWVVASSVGWGVGFAIVLTSAAVVIAAGSLPIALSVGAAAGILGGLLAGAISGLGLPLQGGRPVSTA